MKVVSIIGGTFYGNRGAEAMLSATAGVLGESVDEELRFNVFSYYPGADRKLTDDERIRIFSATPAYLVLVLLPSCILLRVLRLIGMAYLTRFLPSSARALANSQVLLCIAGVSFVDGRTKFLPFNVATILPAMILGVPVVKLSQAMGSFNSRINRLLARQFLGRCQLIFARGETTYRHLQALLGQTASIRRANDLAFLFVPRYSLSRPASGLEIMLEALRELRAEGSGVIGVCPSAVVAKRAREAGSDYIGQTQVLLRALADRGYAVALYPNATRGDDMGKEHNNDLPLINAILRSLEVDVRRRIVTFDRSWNASQIHEIVSACDLHIVSRFHAMVAALSAGIPTVVVGWSHKYMEVMELFEQSDMVLNDRSGGATLVMDRVEQLMRQRSARADSIARALPAVKDCSRSQLVEVRNLIS